MLSLKASVSLLGMQPQTAIAMFIAEQAMHDLGYKLTVTSVTDSEHKPTSLHYKGLAFDIRTSRAGISQDEAVRIAGELRKRIGPQFQVLVEGPPFNTKTPHIHVEFDPKTKKRKRKS